LYDAALFFGGLLLGCLITVSLGFPAVGRAVAKILAVLLLGCGIGLLVWVSVTVYRQEVLRPPFGWNVITEVSEAFGWGTGFFVGGVVSLVLAFWGRASAKDQADRS
jgi:hypothetical protein